MLVPVSCPPLPSFQPWSSTDQASLKDRSSTDQVSEGGAGRGGTVIKATLKHTTVNKSTDQISNV